MCTEPRPHAELIKAWADGAIIQYEFPSGMWNDVAMNRPSWHDNESYRVKPEPTDIEKYGAEVGDVWKTAVGDTLTVLDACCGSVIALRTRAKVPHTELGGLLFRRGVVNKLGV